MDEIKLNLDFNLYIYLILINNSHNQKFLHFYHQKQLLYMVLI